MYLKLRSYISLGIVFQLCVMLSCVEPLDQQTDCERATEHLQNCFGGVATKTSCETEEAINEANMIMSMTCDELTLQVADTKSDIGSAIATQSCKWGLYQFCDTPQCSSQEDEPEPWLPSPHIDSPSICAREALQYEGCGACQYYTCREEEAQCGPDGYLMYYAYRYCNRFRLVTEPKVSEEGKLWLRKIRRCLITTLDQAEPGTDCQSISDNGFGSHPGCYVDTGFCSLPVSDWIAVLNTIDTFDFNFRESFITGQKCLEDWLFKARF